MAISGYQPWVAHNRAVVTNTVNMLVAEAEKIILKGLKQCADWIIDDIVKQRDTAIPVYTGNLHDSTGVAVYVNGRTFYMKVPPKSAKRMQHTGPSRGNRRNIDGHEFLMLSISEGASVYNNGIWIVIYSAVPYAARIDTLGSPLGRGKDYFWNLKNTLLGYVKGSFEELKQIRIINV